MSTTETEIIQELALVVIDKLRAAKLGLYPSMRIMGYLTITVAEGVDLEGEADEIA